MIYAGNIVWLGHEAEIEEKYGEKKIPVEAFAYDACKEKLIDEVDDRRKFIRESFESCEKTTKKELVDRAQQFM